MEAAALGHQDKDSPGNSCALLGEDSRTAGLLARVPLPGAKMAAPLLPELEEPDDSHSPRYQNGDRNGSVQLTQVARL